MQSPSIEFDPHATNACSPATEAFVNDCVAGAGTPGVHAQATGPSAPSDIPPLDPSPHHQPDPVSPPPTPKPHPEPMRDPEPGAPQPGEDPYPIVDPVPPTAPQPIVT